MSRLISKTLLVFGAFLNNKPGATNLPQTIKHWQLRLGAGDHDHDEQPEEVQRLGHDPMYPVGSEGADTTKRNDQNLLLIGSISSSKRLLRTQTPRYYLNTVQ